MKTIFFGLLFCLPFFVFSQKQKKVEILNADLLEHTEVNGEPVRKLTGNVRLKHKEVVLNADNAFFYVNKNNINAFGNVHINQADTIDIYADTLKYFGDQQRSSLHNNVTLTDGDLTLRTNQLHYNHNTNTATYTTGARLQQDSTLLTSQRGYYLADINKLIFKTNVHLTDPAYELTADTLHFNLNTEVADFLGPTNITTSDSSHIYTESGWYDTRNLTAFFTQNVSITDDPQVIKADTIFFDQKTTYGRALGNMRWADTTQNIIVESDFAEYFGRQGGVTATKNAVMTYLISGDSLFITADTLRSELDTNDVRAFFAYHGVRLFKHDLQGIADSLYYSYSDSTFRFYIDPVIWSDNSQMKGDTITLQMRDSKMHKIDLIANAFITNKSDTTLFNQIRGKNIYGFFKNNEMDYMLVKGNAQSVYYALNDKNAYFGANKAEGSDMKLYFKDNRVNRIMLLNKPDGKFYPMKGLNVKDLELKDFVWLEEKRPKSKEKILSAE